MRSFEQSIVDQDKVAVWELYKDFLDVWKIPCHDPCDVISCVVPEAKFADGSIPITALLDIISDVFTVLKRIFKFLHFIFIYQATDKDVPKTRDTLG